MKITNKQLERERAEMEREAERVVMEKADENDKNNKKINSELQEIKKALSSKEGELSSYKKRSEDTIADLTSKLLSSTSKCESLSSSQSSLQREFSESRSSLEEHKIEASRVKRILEEREGEIRDMEGKIREGRVICEKYEGMR